MSTQSEWALLASNLGLTYFKRAQLPYPILQAIAGISMGFPVAIEQTTEYRRNAVIYLIRFPEGNDLEQIKGKLPENLKNVVGLTDGSLVLNQGFLLKTPSKEVISEIFQQLKDALVSSVQPPSGLCERCKLNQGDFHLMNGFPMQLCAACISAIQIEQRESTRAYEQLEARPLLATVLGGLAALVGGIIWGLVGLSTGRILALVALGMGYLVAWSIKKGMGKVTRYGQILTIVLTLAGVFLGDLLLVTLAIAKEFQEAVSLDLLFKVIQVYPALIMENPIDIILSLFFGLLGAVFAIAQFQRTPKPVKIV